MSETYSHQVLRVVVAQICQAIGWHSIQSGTLDIMVDTAKRYIQALGQDTHRFTELAHRTEPNLDDLSEAFNDWKINYADVLEYIKNVSPEECAVKVPQYPAKKESHLNFLKPGSKEVLTRPVHIPEYMPPMLVEQEEEQMKPGSEQEKLQNRDGEIDVVTLSPNETSQSKAQSDFVAPATVPKARFSSQTTDEEVGRAVRENTSVIMTTSGFISPSRAGKLPDPKLSGDFNDIIQQLIAQELPPLPPKLHPQPPQGPSAKPSVIDQKDPELITTPIIPSPLAIASANPDKFDVKAKSRKTSDKKPPGESRPKQRTTKTHIHKVKEAPARKHVSKKAIREIPLEEIRTPALFPPDIPLPINLATVKKHPEESTEAPFIEGKISAEPDKLKMNIFKRISSAKTAGVKEEKPPIVDVPPMQPPLVQEPELKIIPQPVEMRTPKKRQNPNKNSEPKERKKPKTERVSKKQKMLMNQTTMVENPMRLDYNYPRQGGSGDFHPNTPPMPISVDSKTPAGIPIFPGQQLPLQVTQPARPPPSTAPHNLFHLFNFTNSPGLIPPPSGFFGNPFGLPTQQTPAGLPFPPSVMRGPNPFNLMPLSRFPPINAQISPNPPPIPETPSSQPLLDKSQCNVAPLVPESLKLEPLVLNMSSSGNSSAIVPKNEPTENPVDDEEAKRRKQEKKVKKKKEKKEKTKDKEKKREEKRALKEAMKVSKAKEKREKKKEKERLEREGNVADESPAIVPKLTLKLGAAHSPTPVSPDGTRKLTIKPIKRDPGLMNETDIGEMPELARISPLVTRPPKPKSPSQATFSLYQHSPTGSGLLSTPGSSSVKGFGTPLSSPGEHRMKSPTSSMMTPIPARGRPRGSGNKQHTTVTSSTPVTPGLTLGLNLSLDTSLIPEKLPINSMRDADGNQVWICPACGRVDDGTPMIGCDGCDAWYHWVCVGIQVPPDATEDWYCRVCIVKKQEMQMSGGAGVGSDKKKKRKKREKKLQV
ncbi:hypothetical protein DMENIID0001_143440 [Sergentomyia squamirostris]